MLSLLSLTYHCQVISGCHGTDCRFLILTISIERGREIVALRDNVLFQVINGLLGRFQVTLVSEVFVCHDQCRGGTGSRTARSIHVAMIIPIFAREMPVSFQQFQHTVHQRAHLHFPFLVLTTLPFLISKVVKHGIHRFRLLTDAMYDVGISRDAIRYVHLFLEIALGGKAVLKPAVVNGLSHLYQPLVTRLLTVFQCIEGIQQYSSAKAELHVVGRKAVVTTDAQARMVFQRIFVDIRLAEIIRQLLFHFCR